MRFVAVLKVNHKKNKDKSMLTLRLPGEKEVLLQQEKFPTIKNSEVLIEVFLTLTLKRLFKS